jgi:hypothetical protein
VIGGRTGGFGRASYPRSVSEPAAGRLRRTRHTVTVRRVPPGPGAYSGEDWFEWEERHGLGPASNATGPNDEILVQVSYVEGKPTA